MDQSEKRDLLESLSGLEIKENIKVYISKHKPFNYNIIAFDNEEYIYTKKMEDLKK